MWEKIKEGLQLMGMVILAILGCAAIGAYILYQIFGHKPFG